LEVKEMTLVELHKVLGDRINVTLDDNLTTEQRETENEQSKIVVGIAKQMINNGKLILEYEKNLAQVKNLEHSVLKEMIGE
jgi:membrane-associated HD superfamily phosphohydrolase